MCKRSVMFIKSCVVNYIYQELRVRIYSYLKSFSKKRKNWIFVEFGDYVHNAT
jgi:hypothetical protein